MPAARPGLFPASENSHHQSDPAPTESLLTCCRDAARPFFKTVLVLVKKSSHHLLGPHGSHPLLFARVIVVRAKDASSVQALVINARRVRRPVKDTSCRGGGEESRDTRIRYANKPAQEERKKQQKKRGHRASR